MLVLSTVADAVKALGSALGLTSGTTITSSNGTLTGSVISGSVTTSDNVTYTGSINIRYWCHTAYLLVVMTVLCQST